MPQKRSHDDVEISPGSSGEQAGGQPDTQPYPRKRVAVACELCRMRKTRCDAGKPKCGLCKELDVECSYHAPNSATNPRDPSDQLQRIESHLISLGDKITGISQNVEAVTLVSLQTDSCPSVYIHPSGLANPTSPADRSILQRPSTFSDLAPSPNSSHRSFRQSQGEVMCARPNLLTFCSPPGLSQSWDDTEAFYDDELAAGEAIARQVENVDRHTIDFSKKTLKALQQSFVESFLRWLPICDVQDLIARVNLAGEDIFSSATVASCFSLLAFAVGAAAQAGSPNAGSNISGIEYFARGSQILEKIVNKEDQLAIMQCRLLQVAYFQLCIRPLQAWDTIGYVARDSMHLLSSSRPKKWGRKKQETLQRIFWVCSILLHELEAVLMMHPTGLRFYHDFVPLPLSEQEDISFYHFLAQASLRKLLMETLDVVGFKSGRVVHAPAITLELRNGVREWYNHLPPAIRFPVDRSPLFDLRKSFLRCQYIALFVLMGWPAVLRILECGDSPSTESHERLFAADKEHATECIQSCTLLLISAEETLACLNLGSQLTLWACYASFVELILTYKVPSLSFIPETQTTEHIISGYELLSAWRHLPVIKRGLDRARELMIASEIAVPDNTAK